MGTRPAQTHECEGLKTLGLRCEVYWPRSGSAGFWLIEDRSSAEGEGENLTGVEFCPFCGIKLPEIERE